MCVLETGVLFLNLSGSGRCDSSVYDKKLLAMLEGMGHLVCSRGCTNSTFSAPTLADYLVYLFRVGLAWHTIGIYHSAISAFGNHHHKASNHNIISILILFYYSTPSCKQFDIWDI